METTLTQVVNQALPRLRAIGETDASAKPAPGYRQARWSDIVTLWAAYNLHLAVVIGNIDPACAEHVWHHPEADYRLGFLASDYVVHLRHHLEQIGVD